MPLGFIAGGLLFLYNFSQRKEGVYMDSYDNDGLLLAMDDDLFPIEAEKPKESDRNHVALF